MADRVIVPEDWTFIRGGKPQMDDIIFRYPAMALAAQVLAVVALGAARSALDWVRSDALARTSITGAPSPAARAYVQIDFARAEGLLAGARSAFYDAIETGWRQMETQARSTGLPTSVCATPPRRPLRMGLRPLASPSCLVVRTP